MTTHMHINFLKKPYFQPNYQDTICIAILCLQPPSVHIARNVLLNVRSALLPVVCQCPSGEIGVLYIIFRGVTIIHINQ